MDHHLCPYPEYEDSGLPWLGKVPSHWDISRSKRLFAERKERAREDDEQLSATQSHGVIRQSDYERHVGRKVTRILLHLDKRKHVEKDDFVISMRSFQGGLERAWCPGAIRSSYVVLSPGQKIYVPYFAHLFKCHSYIQALRATSDFIRDGQDLTFSNFCLVDLPVLPLPEQRAIADYLDANAAQVRRFVRNRRRLIEVLDEKKQAIINEAVTRGLSHGGRYRPSEKPWLGDIPESWQTRRLKYVAELRVSNVDKHTKADEIPVRLCNYTDVYKNSVITSDMPFMTATATPDEIRTFHIEVGDVIITKDSEDWQDIGVPAYVAETADDLVCGYHLAILRPRPNVISGRFLAYLMRCNGVATQLSLAASGVTRYGLSHGAIKAISLPVAPVEEQEPLADRIDDATAALTKAIGQANREIDLIHEYRTRLIADVVTGKLDVRHLAPPPGAAELDDTDSNEIDEIDAEEALDDELDGAEEGDLAEEAVHADD